jgi:hypothetical protein
MKVKIWIETIGSVADGAWTQVGRIESNAEKVRREIRAFLEKKGFQAKDVRLFATDGRDPGDNWLVDSGRFVATRF